MPAITTANFLLFGAGAVTFAAAEFVAATITRSIRHYCRQKRINSPEYQARLKKYNNQRFAAIAREIAPEVRHEDGE